jgi:hypothetical protein
MASIAKRPDGRWRARYRDRTGKEIARHFARKVDAQRWLDEVTTAVANGVYVHPSRSRVTIGEWAYKWLDTKTNLKATTRRDYESLLQAHVVPRWGDVALADVHHEDITTWLAELSARGLSASRVRAAHVALSQMLKLAVRSGRLARNPADYVPLPRVNGPDGGTSRTRRSSDWPMPPATTAPQFCPRLHGRAVRGDGGAVRRQDRHVAAPRDDRRGARRGRRPDRSQQAQDPSGPRRPHSALPR